MSSIASQPLSTPLKMETVSNQDSSSLNVGPQKPLLPSKRKTTPETFSSSTPLQSPRGQPNKRMMRNESMPSKNASPRVQVSKSKTAPLEVSPKVQSESYVRAKMRETLSAALSVGIQNKEDKNITHEAGNVGPGHTADVDNEGQKPGQKPQYNYVMPDTDGSFGDTLFVKDELLQGNGLSWAWEMDVDGKSNSGLTNQESQGGESGNISKDTNVGGKVTDSPQELGFKIEAELFKLFGGVNKKYKEKGRSLMFNLKDPNNPELREKVLSGKISPERLCSMTPEELASKELSEWRMAKAEELDKMIVLPDSDIDMRRLVKKTHKGEYEVVDFEQDDGISVEVGMGVGSSSFTQFRPKKKKNEENVNVNMSSDGQQVKVTVEGNDFMQELIVEEFKDEGFLQPIVSLDEFMESLDTEPPFENLTVDKEKKGSGDEKESCGLASGEVEPRVKPVDLLTSVERKVVTPSIAIGEWLWEGDLQLAISSTVSVLGLFRSGEKTSTKEWPGSMEIKGRVRLEAFEKFLQELPMSRSRAVMVVHFLLKDNSPEFHRASLSESIESYVTEERVGFGEPSPGTEVYFCPPHKRITEMLTRLLSKDQTEIQKSTDNGLIGVVVWRRPQPPAATLPPHHKHRKNSSSRRQEINTTTNLKPPPPPPNDDNDNDNDNDDDDDIPPGFGPGVVARDEDDLPEFSFSGGSNPSRQTLPTLPVQTVSQSGQVMVQSSTTTRPIAPHMRQLVHEYGHTGNININNNNINSNSNSVQWNGNRNRQWNRDEEDDIPEWQPQFQVHQVPNHMVNQVRPVMGPNHVIPVMNVLPPPPPNVMQNVWVQPPGALHGLPPNAGMPGWHYGGQWRPEEPRGRGF